MKNKIVIASVCAGVFIVGLIGLNVFNKVSDQKLIERYEGVNQQSIPLRDKIRLFDAYGRETMQVEMMQIAYAIARSSGLEDLSPGEKRKVANKVTDILEAIPGGADTAATLRKKMT